MRRLWAGFRRVGISKSKRFATRLGSNAHCRLSAFLRCRTKRDWTLRLSDRRRRPDELRGPERWVIPAPCHGPGRKACALRRSDKPVNVFLPARVFTARACTSGAGQPPAPLLPVELQRRCRPGGSSPPRRFPHARAGRHLPCGSPPGPRPARAGPGMREARPMAQDAGADFQNGK